MKRAILKLIAAAVLGLAIFGVDVVWGFAHLPPPDNYCTASGGHLLPDPDDAGLFWCKRQDAPAAVTVPSATPLLDRGAQANR